MAKYVVGVDVGGTNTDAVCLDGNDVLEFSKVPTTADVTTGVKNALQDLLGKLKDQGSICRVNIGTTHFVNAVIQRQHLTPVAVVRLCGTATHAVKPFIDFPEDLKQAICSTTHLINGGYQFDGQAITEVSEDEVLKCIKEIKAKGVVNVVISGVFSPVNQEQEEQVASLFKKHYDGVSLTLSHQVGQMGLLERENASILNESLKPLCARTITAFITALQELKLQCPLFLTQNDGTVISAEQTLHFPVHTFSSGPTNSMRGAAHLSGVKDAVVIDIGGTTSDVGCLMAGFPKEASARVKVGGVTTNFRMPDVVSIGLGGGSKVRHQMGSDGKVSDLTIGPDSVSYQLSTVSRIFGGDILTTSDIAVATKMATMGDSALVQDLSPELLKAAIDKIHRMLEDLIDLVKLSDDDVPVILVGGGSILVDEQRKLKGSSKVFKPPHFQVANAVGAALSQVGGLRDTVVALANISRDEALDAAKQQAIQNAVNNGAQADTVEITEISEVPLAYLPGNATRIKVKAVGNLAVSEEGGQLPQQQATPAGAGEQIPSGEMHQTSVSDSPSTHPEITQQATSSLSTQQTEPNIDPKTGEWSLSPWDVECIGVGAGILGCGGGGSPHLGTLMTLQQLKEGKTIKVITPERLDTTPELTGVVATIGFMGAPGVIIEKMPSGTETTDAMLCMQDLFAAGFTKQESYEGKLGGVDIEKKDGGYFIDDFPQQSKQGDTGPKVVAVMSAEIGGLNAMEPLVMAAMTGIPVVDCDGMGRAFPELQMFAPAIYGESLCPSTLVDDKGTERCVALQTDTSKDLENYFRVNVVKKGCSAAIAISPLVKDQIMRHSVLYSMSRAWHLGKSVLMAQHSKTDPIDTIVKHENGKVLIKGKISDVTRNRVGGFDRGTLKVDGTAVFAGQQLSVDFQNENLIAKLVKHTDGDMMGKVLATVPDLICITDVDSGQPITTEEVRFGLRVAVVALPCSPLLATDRALKVIGPKAFGYEDIQFNSVGDYMSHMPIPTKPTLV